MKVLGLDPGSRNLGFGVVERTGHRWRWIESGAVHLDGRKPLPERLTAIYDATVRLLETHRPDLVAIEECFVARSPRAALVLGQVRGVLFLAVHQAATQSVEFAARSVKLASVGQGGAVKGQVQFMVPRLLDGCPESLGEDEADALAVAWCGAIHSGDGGRT